MIVLVEFFQYQIECFNQVSQSVEFVLHLAPDLAAQGGYKEEYFHVEVLYFERYFCLPGKTRNWSDFELNFPHNLTIHPIRYEYVLVRFYSLDDPLQGPILATNRSSDGAVEYYITQTLESFDANDIVIPFMQAFVVVFQTRMM